MYSINRGLCNAYNIILQAQLNVMYGITNCVNKQTVAYAITVLYLYLSLTFNSHLSLMQSLNIIAYYTLQNVLPEMLYTISSKSCQLSKAIRWCLFMSSHVLHQIIKILCAVIYTEFLALGRRSFFYISLNSCVTLKSKKNKHTVYNNTELYYGI